jgi:hypothetical protein
MLMLPPARPSPDRVSLRFGEVPANACELSGGGFGEHDGPVRMLAGRQEREAVGDQLGTGRFEEPLAVEQERNEAGETLVVAAWKFEHREAVQSPPGEGDFAVLPELIVSQRGAPEADHDQGGRRRSFTELEGLTHGRRQLRRGRLGLR